METKVKVTQIGMDCHRRFSNATARGGDGRVVWRQRLEHGKRVQLRRALRAWPQGTPVVLEGTFGWGWMSDELQGAGLEPHLASSGKVAAWRAARGLAKSNRTDADLLSELWSQQPGWWEVWLAPREVRQQREWLRFRLGLVKMQTQLKNRIHAVLHRQGIVQEHADLFGRAGRRFLSLLVEEQDGTLPESARATLRGWLQLLDQVRGQMARVTRELRRQVERSPTAERLRSLPGICYILAYTVTAEVGDMGRFPSAKHLCSYSLLAPRADDTGEELDGPPLGRHVGRVGRRTLKWAWIEAAHGAVRAGGRFRRLFDAYTDGGKRNRNRGYIRVARDLCAKAYVCCKKDVDYTEDPPARPGSRRPPRSGAAETVSRTGKTRSCEKTRPGRGQPHHPMVAVR